MTTKTAMWSARATAGANYADALSALRAAYITLAAYDAAFANRNVGYANVNPDNRGPIRSFAEGGINIIPAGLRHGEFAADGLGGIRDAVAAQAATYLADLTEG